MCPAACARTFEAWTKPGRVPGQATKPRYFATARRVPDARRGAKGGDDVKTANEQSRSSRYSRRSFLRRAGAGAGAVAVSGGLGAAMAPRAAAARSATVSTGPTTFGRIFPNLPPFAAATDDVKAALKDLGKPGGLLDAKDDLSKGPVLLITEPGLSANNRNNPTHTAGTTFFGQFVDHDI